VLAGMGKCKEVIYRPFLYGIFVITINVISFAWLSEGVQILQSARIHKHFNR
jgi:hypothetical protein